ncbi:MAG: phospholipase D family protein [Aigarchaeota archaeon]|nr:phospholipase D family protein [Candidatus Pelearchaeum maunauluense]
MRPLFIALVILLVLATGFAAGWIVKPGEAITETYVKTVSEIVTETTTLEVERTATVVETTLVATTVVSASPTTVTERIVITAQPEAGYVSEVCFSPGGGCSNLLIKLIDGAKESVYVMIFSFTLDGVAEALIRAAARGVDIKVVIEANNAYSKGSVYQRLRSAGVDVRLDSNPYLMHHKVAIIDGYIVVTGSMNWSFSGDRRNDENMVVIEGYEVAKLFKAEFDRVWRAAQT